MFKLYKESFEWGKCISPPKRETGLDSQTASESLYCVVLQSHSKKAAGNTQQDLYTYIQTQFYSF